MSNCELMSFFYGLEPPMLALILREWGKLGLDLEAEAQKAIDAWVKH